MASGSVITLWSNSPYDFPATCGLVVVTLIRVVWWTAYVIQVIGQAGQP